GKFSLSVDAGTAGLLAVVGTDATYLDASGRTVPVERKMILRSAPEQAANGGSVTISPLSTEVVRLMQGEALGFDQAQAQLAARLSLPGR
ncbi:hypothetical protein ACQV88_26545, partial [Ralstonia pseudosolanacearum]